MTTPTANQTKNNGDLPLGVLHICFDKGHSMFSVYTTQNSRSQWGLNKWSRCGWEDHWQYDHSSFNPNFKEQ
jgi:hypothetical protein